MGSPHSQDLSRVRSLGEKVIMENSLVVTVVLLVVGVFVVRLFNRSRALRLPPGPKPWPVLGNLPHFGKIPQRTLGELSKKYGPLMFMKLGSKPAVVVSSAALAKEFLQTQGEVFASRPETLAARILGFDRQGIGGSAYGPAFRRLRAILSSELLSIKRLQQFQDVRREEVFSMVQNILDATHEGLCAQINEKVLATTNNVVTRMLFSKSYCGIKTATGDLPNDSKEFQSLILQTTATGLTPFIGNFIPILAWLDPKGVRNKMWDLRRRWDEFLERIFLEHRVEKESDKPKDFVNMLFSIHDRNDGSVTDLVMKAFVKEVIVGGTETAAGQTLWTILELASNLEVQKKLHEELDSVVGRDRFVEETDIPNLPYLQAVVKEIFRLHPTLPLLVPHESTNSKPIQVAGYDIPAHTQLLVNISVVQKDPTVWENPETFDPERFVGSPIDVKGQHFQLLPFGSGRRICPGLNMGLLMVQFKVAQLVHAFEWRFPEGGSLELLGDVEVQKGMVSPKPIAYKVSPRLPPRVYSTLQ